MDTNLSVDEALLHLPDTLKTTLALLHAADDDVAELTLGTLPMGSRATLSAMGVIVSAPSTESAELDAPVIVSLTPYGRELITAAALEGLSPEVVEALAALEEARARRATALASTVWAKQLIEADS